MLYRLICQKPAHFLSAQMALVNTFFQMFIVLGMYNFADRNPYNVQKFATGLVSQPGWATQKPTAFKTVLETLNLCLDFLRRDTNNIIVIHCMDGKSNTAVLVVGLLIASSDSPFDSRLFWLFSENFWPFSNFALFLNVLVLLYFLPDSLEGPAKINSTSTISGKIS